MLGTVLSEQMKISKHKQGGRVLVLSPPGPSSPGSHGSSRDASFKQVAKDIAISRRFRLHGSAILECDGHGGHTCCAMGCALSWTKMNEAYAGPPFSESARNRTGSVNGHVIKGDWVLGWGRAT